MRHVTQRGLDLIKHHEGFRPRAYLCPAGKLTIGYGHVILPHERLSTVSQAEAEVILSIDVEKAEKGVIRLISVPLSDGQFDALVSFTFNLGTGALQRSTLRSKINRGEMVEASNEFGKWVWARGKKLKGLVLRREDERRVYLS